jgi:hypothetical protein
MATLFDAKDLEDIDLKCPGESGEYNPPETMTNKYGESMYAYVTLVMLGDSYIPAAIVMAYTLRKLNTLADLVVLVTRDVSSKGINILEHFFDYVKLVSFINVPNWRGRDKKNYLNFVFTKFKALNLTQYKKVILIDADALILNYPDHLFSLQAPAGVYLDDKKKFITYDSRGNYVLPDNKKIQWYEEYCKCCGHGKIIPKEVTDRILTNKKNSGIGGGLMVLEPKEGELERIIEDVTHGKGKNRVNKFFVWPEQQYLCARYSGKWTSINPVFFGLQGYPHWKVLNGLQYAGDKPFILNSKVSMAERAKYPDFVLWHAYYSEILQQYPILLTNSVLTDVNSMNEYFTRMARPGKEFSGKKLFRSIRSYNKKKYNKLHHNFAMVNNNVSRITNASYFHVDVSKPYNHKDVNIMYNIKQNDYGALLNKLHDYTQNMKTDYFTKLRDNYKKSEKTNKINELNLSDIEKDCLATHYTMCRKDMFIITLWPKALKETDTNKIIKQLENDGDVCYVRELEVNYNCLRNLLFYMYRDFTMKDRRNFVDKKMSYIEATIDSPNKIIVLLFDNVKHKKISGQGSEYKRVLRKLLSEVSSKGKIWGNDLLHINDYHSEAVEYCQMLLNKNSRKILSLRKLNRTFGDMYKTFFSRFNTLRKWCYTMIDREKMMRFCLLGGVLWYILGVRPANDIDGIVINTNNNTEDDKEFEKLIYSTFVDNKTKIEFADMGLIDSKHFLDSWTKKNNELLDAIKVCSFDELTMNPEHHFYFGGLKIINIEYEIARKFIRMRGQDVADFAVMYFKFKDIVQTTIQMDSTNRIIYPKYSGTMHDNIGTVKKAMKLIKQRYYNNDYRELSENIIRKMFAQ